MGEVSIRDLRNHARDVIDRVERGECLLVTSDGYGTHPTERLPVKVNLLIERWSQVPRLDPEGLHRDPDEVIDPRL